MHSATYTTAWNMGLTCAAQCSQHAMIAGAAADTAPPSSPTSAVPLTDTAGAPGTAACRCAAPCRLLDCLSTIVSTGWSTAPRAWEYSALAPQARPLSAVLRRWGCMLDEGAHVSFYFHRYNGFGYGPDELQPGLRALLDFVWFGCGSVLVLVRLHVGSIDDGCADVCAARPRCRPADDPTLHTIIRYPKPSPNFQKCSIISTDALDFLCQVWFYANHASKCSEYAHTRVRASQIGHPPTHPHAREMCLPSLLLGCL
jgi:hypothetical protein